MDTDIASRIVDAALKVFSEVGYDEARMQDIAREAHISTGTIYNYFKNKKELFNVLAQPQLELLRPNYLRKRKEILNAALNLFSKKGYSGATMDDIAGEVGCSKAALYQYYKNKEEIFNALIDETNVQQLITTLRAIPADEDIYKAMTKIGTHILKMYRKPARLNLFKVVMSESVRFPEAGEILYTQVISKTTKNLAVFLEEKKKEGELPADLDTYFAARSFFGILLSFIIVDRIFNPKKAAFYIEEIVQQSVEIFLNGIKFTA